ncbi:polysaccharide deacetylase family protein [Chachezhania antarctica]|uniref:polysaccharide deacetylase family protein n=1 Tax=Chachezhania antarctica TaxID=2340860 RepID=UPI000EAEA485|nr:polysaccharide deacetylase family protein [Chachezhania antarctica]|tara:strand:- start:1874 stop:2770 length:897 start_codon:yes stop_codon:yes gene_type:complete
MSLLKLRDHGRYDYSPLPDRPDFTWPDGKRLAVSICNNIEVFSFCDGMGSDSAQVGAPQTSRNYAWRDYGNRVGQWYLFDLLDEMAMPASHNFNSLLFDTCPQIADRMIARGDEFVGHGRTNGERQDSLPPGGEKVLIEEAYAAITAYTGTSPAGWLGPYLAQTHETLDLLRETGFSYVLDWPADDQPFWMRTRTSPILSVPYSIEVNDSPVMIFRQQGSESFERMMIDQFDEMLLQSARYPLCYTIVLHPFVIGHPYRLRALRRALTHIASHRDDIWVTTPGGVAQHYAGIFPPEAA